MADLPNELTVDDTTYSVATYTGDEGEVITLTNGEDVKLLSPNTTPEELAKYADPNAEGYAL